MRISIFLEKIGGGRIRIRIHGTIFSYRLQPINGYTYTSSVWQDGRGTISCTWVNQVNQIESEHIVRSNDNSFLTFPFFRTWKESWDDASCVFSSSFVRQWMQKGLKKRDFFLSHPHPIFHPPTYTLCVMLFCSLSFPALLFLPSLITRNRLFSGSWFLVVDH